MAFGYCSGICRGWRGHNIRINRPPGALNLLSQMIQEAKAGRLSPAVPAERQLANIRSAIARDLPLATLCNKHVRALSIAGGGPSLIDTYTELGDVVATINGSLKFLMGRLDFNPKAHYFCGVCDAGEHIADMIVATENVRYYIASNVDPSVFDKLKGCDVRLWHQTPQSFDHPAGVQQILDTAYNGNWRAIGGGCTMGLRWVPLGYFLGFRNFALHGMDSSFRDSATHAYPDSFSSKERVHFKGRLTKPGFIEQVGDFFDMMERYSTLDNIGIKMYGDGLLQDEWKRFHEERIEVATNQSAACRSDAEGTSSGHQADAGIGPRDGQVDVSRDEEIEERHSHDGGGALSTSSPHLPLVCCVKTGVKYGPEYVVRLRDNVRNNLSVDHRFICFTDMDVPGVACEPLPANLPGWWAKIGLFKLGRPLLYFDLDVIPTGPLDLLLDWRGFGAIKDWWQPGLNSSVMKLSGNEGHVWDNFQIGMISQYPGDQDYITKQFPPNLKTFPPHWFPSYKANHCVAGPPEGAMAVIFHGFPKPDQLGGWVADAWRGYKPQEVRTDVH